MLKGLNLQLFANLDEILENHKDTFEGMDSIKEQFDKISTKLNELGYDILLNNKQKAEFIPSSRLSEVVAQRDTFKNKVEELNKELQKLKDGAGDNQTLKDQLQKLMDQNNDLLKELETTRINAEIMIAARDAINPKDILAFIDMNNIKTNAKGEISGVDAEIARLKEEKPYLFKNTEDKGRKGGADLNNGDKGEKVTNSINAMIRRAAGRHF